jgi:hypothetical protein
VPETRRAPPGTSAARHQTELSKLGPANREDALGAIQILGSEVQRSPGTRAASTTAAGIPKFWGCVGTLTFPARTGLAQALTGILVFRDEDSAGSYDVLAVSRSISSTTCAVVRCRE